MLRVIRGIECGLQKKENFWSAKMSCSTRINCLKAEIKARRFRTCLRQKKVTFKSNLEEFFVGETSNSSGVSIEDSTTGGEVWRKTHRNTVVATIRGGLMKWCLPLSDSVETRPRSLRAQMASDWTSTTKKIPSQPKRFGNQHAETPRAACNRCGERTV